MLQINKPRAVEGHEVEYYGRTEPETASAAALIDTFFRVVRRQFAIIALFTVLTIVLGVLYLYVTPLTFTAEATMLLDRGRFLDQQAAIVFGCPGRQLRRGK